MIQISKLADKEYIYIFKIYSKDIYSKIYSKYIFKNIFKRYIHIYSKIEEKMDKIYAKKNLIQSLESIKNQMEIWHVTDNNQ